MDVVSPEPNISSLKPLVKSQKAQPATEGRYGVNFAVYRPHNEGFVSTKLASRIPEMRMILTTTLGRVAFEQVNKPW